MQSVKSTNLKHMVDGTSNPVNEASESREHFQPVYEYLLIALGACWFLVIVCELYFGRDLVDVISFRVQDATWLPANVGPSRSISVIFKFGLAMQQSTTHLRISLNTRRNPRRKHFGFLKRS